MLVEELQSGKQSCRARYYLHEDDHVLEGVVTLRLGDERYEMRPTACVAAGQREGYGLINASDLPCRDLVTGENNPNDGGRVHRFEQDPGARTRGELRDG